MTNDLPFIFGKTAEGEHFTDREQETAQLKMNLLNHREVIEEYDLGSSANVAGIKKALIGKELIDIVNNKLQISDPILQHWLRYAPIRL